MHHAYPISFPQQHNAMGSLHNIDFGSRNWLSSPGPRFDGSDRFCGSKVPGSVSGKPGSGPEALLRFRVQKVACPGFRRFRYSVPEVCMEPALGTGFGEPGVLRRFRVPEIPLPRFRRKLLCIVCTKDMNAKPTNPKHNFKHCGFTHPKTNGWKAILGWFVDVCPTSN